MLKFPHSHWIVLNIAEALSTSHEKTPTGRYFITVFKTNPSLNVDARINSGSTNSSKGYARRRNRHNLIWVAS